VKRVEHFFKQAYIEGLIWWHYGSFSPQRIQLVDSDQYVYVDPHDPRARKKIIADTIRGRFPRNQRFWREAVATLQPDTALDIGLNFGECLFSILYRPDTTAYGFDANPQLRPWVEKSLLGHPSRDQIEILFQLVSDGEKGEQEFFIDKRWSGCSTAALDSNKYDQDRYENVVVPKSSIDHELRNRGWAGESLVFKIDVEGYEYRVLTGMRSTLSKVNRFLGLVEFDGDLLEQAGECVSEYWDYLRDSFAVFAFTRSDKWYHANKFTTDQFAKICGKHFHTDLLLTDLHNTEYAETVLRCWHPATVRPSASRRAA